MCKNRPKELIGCRIFPKLNTVMCMKVSGLW